MAAIPLFHKLLFAVVLIESFRLLSSEQARVDPQQLAHSFLPNSVKPLGVQ